MMLSKRPMRFFTSPLSRTLLRACESGRLAAVANSFRCDTTRLCARPRSEEGWSCAACAFQRALTGGGLGLAPLSIGYYTEKMYSDPREIPNILLPCDRWANNILPNDLPHTPIVPV